MSKMPRTSALAILAFVTHLSLAALPSSAQVLPELGGIAAIAAGQDHACVLTSAGAVKCWGSNAEGQLGDGTITDRLTPTPVLGLASGVTAIAAGNEHTCALNAAGAVKCWGRNDSGQVGNGTIDRAVKPVNVVGLSSGVTAIAAGNFHTCAILASGSVKCWGNNQGGQLAYNPSPWVNYVNTPIDVAGLGGPAAKLALGGQHSCALTPGGVVKCWGSDSGGQLGLGFYGGARFSPVDVAGIPPTAIDISAGNAHSCALFTSGNVKCWGTLQGPASGSGQADAQFRALDVPGLTSGVVAIAGGLRHACALFNDGSVKCWGDNSQGQVGDITHTFAFATPTQVYTLTSGISAIATGSLHSCAVTTGGAVRCWGDNRHGQLGDGISGLHRTASDVVGLASGVNAIAAGDAYSCALLASGAVQCWGFNDHGQLGDTTNTIGRAPGNVTGLSSGVMAIAAGFAHACAVTSAGALRCWGANSAGQLGDGMTIDRLSPVDVNGLPANVVAVAAGRFHTCALTQDGGVKCWGSNFLGAIGDGSFQDRLSPTDVSGLASGVKAIAAGTSFSCALMTSGSVKCWGTAVFGLGDGTNSTRLIPVNVLGLAPNVVGIAAGSDYACALTTVGEVRCWGSTNPDRFGTSPGAAIIDGLASGATSIAASAKHTCAAIAGGGAKCWGDNSDGQLGTGDSAVSQSTPLRVARITGIVASLALGSRHSCAIVNGGVTCWGSSVNGEVGDGGPSSRSFPAPVRVSAVPVPPVFALSPESLAFGGQSVNTTSFPQTVTITNTSGVSRLIYSLAAHGGFPVTHDCTTLNAGASCTATVTFLPWYDDTFVAEFDVTSDAGTQPVAVTGKGEKSLVTHFYQAILNRQADAPGKAFWESEASRMQSLGANVNETWFAMAAAFYFSAEYASLSRNDTEFVADLYNTFFNRPPDAPGFAFWTGQMSAGMPREVVLVSFMFSTEFTTFTQAIFGNTAARREVDTVMDFYRGLLSRLPDTGGFNFWVQQFRKAQCAGAGAVYPAVESISIQFATSAEYLARDRTNAQYVGDLYNSFLRRGGDLGGVQYWIDEIARGRRTRESVRQQFVASPEFQNRVAAIIAQGCYLGP